MDVLFLQTAKMFIELVALPASPLYMFPTNNKEKCSEYFESFVAH